MEKWGREIMSPVTGGGQRECRRSKACLWRSWQLAKALPANAFRLCVFACLPPRTSMRILFRPATGPVICRPTFTRTPEIALRKSTRRSARQASSSVPPTNWRQRPPAPTQPVALPPSATPPVKIYPTAPPVTGGDPVRRGTLAGNFPPCQLAIKISSAAMVAHPVCRSLMCLSAPRFMTDKHHLARHFVRCLETC